MNDHRHISLAAPHPFAARIGVALFLVAGAHAAAQVRSSAHYAFTTESMEPGGTSTSAHYRAGTSLPERTTSGTSTAGGTSATAIDPGFVTRTVGGLVNTGVFYNHSSWDGQNAAINDLDSAAVAPDKFSLRPRQTATFANVSTYARGLNGVVLDVAQLGGQVRLSDFSLTVGTNNLPATWGPAPAPSGLAVHWQGAPDGTDRIFIAWPDHQIRNQWLRVELIANETTRLQENAVFYYGHSAGSVAAGTDGVYPDPGAAGGAVVRLDTPATVSSPYDFDRDGNVGSRDIEGVLDALCDNPGLLLLDLTRAEPLAPPGRSPAGFCDRPLFLAVTPAAGATLRFWFAVAAGMSFDVETAPALDAAAQWSGVPPLAVHAAGERLRWIDLDPRTDATRFLRIRSR